MRLGSLIFVVIAVNAWAGDAGTPYPGKIDDTEVRKAIARHSQEARFCYDMQNMKTPGLIGHVAVTFVVDAEGKVTQAAVSESSLKNANVESCLVQRLRRWQFPKPTGGEAQVTFPFNFTK
jgi:TonB family protein